MCRQAICRPKTQVQFLQRDRRLVELLPSLQRRLTPCDPALVRRPVADVPATLVAHPAVSRWAQTDEGGPPPIRGVVFGPAAWTAGIGHLVVLISMGNQGSVRGQELGRIGLVV